jgi:hypothetical protein
MLGREAPVPTVGIVLETAQRRLVNFGMKWADSDEI